MEELHHAAVVELHFARGWKIILSQLWNHLTGYLSLQGQALFWMRLSLGVASVLHSFSDDHLFSGSSCEAPSPQNAMSLSTQDEHSQVH